MVRDLLPLLPSEPHTARRPHRWRLFLHSNGTLKIGFFSIAFIITGIIVYVASFPPYDPSWRLPDWHLPSRFDPDSLELADPNGPLHAPSPSPPSPVSDVLTLEQIRDIVAPTRGFFSRDYSLHLGWNNVRYIFEAALLQAELLNRTLVLPSFLYARACEYNITVCANYATMVNKGDAMGSGQWDGLPIEQQMGFRIPISAMVNITHLRSRQPVITASEYLRLHGQDPESESGNGFWARQSYHTHPNVFETNKTKTPSLFVIENHWYSSINTIRVDYISEAMKRRGKLERHSEPYHYNGSAEYWPPQETTELSVFLRWRGHVMEWGTAMSVLEEKSDLVGDVDLHDDQVVEELLNVHGWEVLHSFNTFGMDPAKLIIGPARLVAQRSSIRGFKDDFHDEDADVVVLAGETHGDTRAGAMMFTEDLQRKRFASSVVHSLIPPQKVLDLAEVLSLRMRQRTGGRMWMGAHMRRGDFVEFGWAMEMGPEDHIQRVKDRLQAGRTALVDLHYNHNWQTYDDLDGVMLDPEQATLPPPRAEDPFFIATDERDPDARRTFAAAGAVFLSDLLTMEDRRDFGWPLMITDLVALVEQQLLVRSSFFYGHGLSSFAGAILNMRAGRGADPRTTVLD
ncbi:hypothetical protein EDB92DRAFT_376405 [Lactarius akahatsu]|uniref:O-fucosyltransferase family protein n=1 Tax=Lactarius akahatsu TaxID=416441 RepID=A0AAD4LJU4_9AGAM|nr:hypothetical protein EDB92DRAFT_376405 [Lactarius akahatsu]